MKDKKNFRAMNCDDCQCAVCLGACMACNECYRAEYAEESYEDFYVKDTGQKECVEI